MTLEAMICPRAPGETYALGVRGEARGRLRFRGGAVGAVRTVD